MIFLTINFSLVFETLILGIMASLIVAISLEIWKKRRKKYHISVTLDSSDIYSSQIGKDVSIRVDYKGGAVENTLVIMCLSITNDGQEDIMFKSHFSDTIKIKIKGYKILSITSEDEKIKPKCGLIDDGASLTWDILKSRESIQLYIAAHSEQSATSMIDRVDCYNNLSFKFRSDCLDNIALSHEMTKMDASKRRFYNGAIMKYACMILICLLSFVSDMFISSRYDMLYEGKAYKNSTLLYTPLFKKYILNSDSAKTKVLTKGNVQNIDSIVPSNPVNTANWISRFYELTILSLIFVSLVVVTINLVGYLRYKKCFMKETGPIKNGKRNITHHGFSGDSD